MITLGNGVRITGMGICDNFVAPGMGRQGSSRPIWDGSSVTINGSTGVIVAPGVSE